MRFLVMIILRIVIFVLINLRATSMLTTTTSPVIVPSQAIIKNHSIFVQPFEVHHQPSQSDFHHSL